MDTNKAPNVINFAEPELVTLNEPINRRKLSSVTTVSLRKLAVQKSKLALYITGLVAVLGFFSGSVQALYDFLRDMVENKQVMEVVKTAVVNN